MKFVGEFNFPSLDQNFQPEPWWGNLEVKLIFCSSCTSFPVDPWGVGETAIFRFSAASRVTLAFGRVPGSVAQDPVALGAAQFSTVFDRGVYSHRRIGGLLRHWCGGDAELVGAIQNFPIFMPWAAATWSYRSTQTGGSVVETMFAGGCLGRFSMWRMAWRCSEVAVVVTAEQWNSSEVAGGHCCSTDERVHA